MVRMMIYAMFKMTIVRILTEVHGLNNDIHDVYHSAQIKWDIVNLRLI